MTSRPSLFLVLALAVALLFLSQLPGLDVLFSPLQYLAVTLHESGHAIACNVTGGSVLGMTVVPDGAGHGGLTWCSGGDIFWVGQMGYLGTTLMGCLLLALHARQAGARFLLCAIAALVALSTLVYMTGALALPQYAGQAAWSIAVGVALTVALLALARWLPAKAADFTVLLIAVQTALNALSDIGVVITHSLGSLASSGSQGFSDATNLEAVTGIPAIVWSLIWGAISIALLALTLRLAYGGRLHATTGNSTDGGDITNKS